MTNKYWVPCEVVLAGPGPDEIIVKVKNSDGAYEEVVLHKADIVNDQVVGIARAYTESKILVSLPREMANGSFAVWVKKSNLVPFLEDLQVCRKTAVTLAYQWTKEMAGPAPQWIKDAIKDGTIKLPKHAQITVDGSHGDVGTWILKRGKHWMVFGDKYFKSHFVKVDGDSKEI